MHIKLIPALLLTLPACILDKDLGDTLPTVTDPTFDPGATDDGGATDTATSDGPEETTTGFPDDCPEGQAHLAPLWQVAYDPPPDAFGFYSGFSPIGRLADGRIAVAGDLHLAGDERGVALVLTAPDGELLGAQMAAVDETPSAAHAFAIGADDQPLVLAEHWPGPDSGSVLRLTRFSSDMALLSEVDLPFLAPKVWPIGPAMALGADGPVVVGPSSATENVIAKLAPDTGVPVWQHTLAGPPDMWVHEVAVGPGGDIAVAAHGEFGISDTDTLRLWRFDPAGALIWEREITVPAYERVTALHFAPDDQIVVLRGTVEFEVSVELLSVEVATGATRWELTVAAPENEFDAWAEDMHVDADHFTIPVTRYKGHHDVEVSMHSLELRTVSFAGDLLDVTPLPGVLGLAGTSWVRSVRGRCGELIVVREYDRLQLMAFAR